MKRYFVLLMAVLLIPTPVLALDENQRGTIAANCSTIKATVTQVLRADTEARIKRGRSYEQTSRLLDAMNAHIGYNSLSQPLLTDMTSDFKQAFSAYKTAFTQYERVMEEAKKTNCAEYPSGFHWKLMLGREQRKHMAEEVAKAEHALKIYRQGVDDLRESVVKRDTP